MDPLFILDWLRIAVSWILVQFHSLFSIVLDPASGWTWVMSIVGLVVVIRILLIPLFVKQIKAMRNMQLIHPQIKEIQKKYAGDRERQSKETMKLYRETGTNPTGFMFANPVAGAHFLRPVPGFAGHCHVQPRRYRLHSTRRL